MESKRRTPILHDQVGAIDAQPIDQGIKIAHVIEETVGDVRLAGLAEADEIGGNAVRDRGNQRQDIAPEIGRGGVAVQE